MYCAYRDEMKKKLFLKSRLLFSNTLRIINNWFFFLSVCLRRVSYVKTSLDEAHKSTHPAASKMT